MFICSNIYFIADSINPIYFMFPVLSDQLNKPILHIWFLQHSTPIKPSIKKQILPIKKNIIGQRCLQNVFSSNIHAMQSLILHRYRKQCCGEREQELWIDLLQSLPVPLRKHFTKLRMCWQEESSKVKA